jgi:hypothetical protein
MRTALLMLFVCGLAHAAPGQYVDEWAALGMPMYGQQFAALSAPREHGGEKVSEATLKLTGEKGAPFFLKVVLAEGMQNGVPYRELFVDTSGEGMCSTDESASRVRPEQRPPGFGAADQPVWMIELQRPLKRTVAFRLSEIPGMIVMAVRGYATGEIATGAGPRRVFVKDANANQVLEAGVDFLYVDLDGNGRLNGAAEQLTAAPAIDVADVILQPKMGAPLTALTWEVVAGGEVWARFVIGVVKVAPEKLVVSIQREGGGAVLLERLGQPVKLQAGNYSVESLSLALPGEKGAPTTHYNFERRGKGQPLVIRAGGSSTFELLGTLTLKPRWSLEGATGKSVPPGATLRCEVDAVSETGLALTGCETGGPEAQYPTKIPPRMELLSPSGKVLFRGAMTYG